MSEDVNPRKKTRRILSIIGSLLSFAALTYIAIMLITGRDLSLSRLLAFFSSRESVELADEYYFDVGRDRVFADLGSSCAAAGTLGIQVLDTGGNEALRNPFRMSRPALSSNGGQAIAFDIGGTSICVFDKTRVIASIETDSAIISASINEKGYFCVCTQGTGGFKGIATVYSGKGIVIFSASLSSGYILSAMLSPDSRSLAILNLADDGSRITFYHDLTSEVSDGVFNLPGGLIIDIWYLSENELIAVSTESLFTVDRDGEGRKLFDFSGRRLHAYTLNGDFLVLHLLDYGVGYRGQLITLDTNGQLIGELYTDHEFISMSSGDGYLAVLRNDGLSFFSVDLQELSPSDESVSAAGASRILAFGDGAALATGDHTAVVFRRAERSTMH